VSLALIIWAFDIQNLYIEVILSQSRKKYLQIIDMFFKIDQSTVIAKIMVIAFKDFEERFRAFDPLKTDTASISFNFPKVFIVSFRDHLYKFLDYNSTIAKKIRALKFVNL